MQKLFRTKNSIIAIIAGVVVVGGLILIGIYYTTSASSSDETELKTKPLVASTFDNRIVMFDLKPETSSTLVEKMPNRVISFEYFHRIKDVFYNTEIGPIRLSNGTFGHSSNYSTHWRKRGMAIDYATDKLYVVDFYRGKLFVIDLKSEYHAVVLTELTQPIDILIDFERRLLFILEKSMILIYHMDGLEGGYAAAVDVKAFAIDRKNGKIYFANAESIKEIDYVNNYMSSFAKMDKEITSMTVYDDVLLYLFDNSSGSFLEACYLINSCKDVYALMTGNRDLTMSMQIKAYDFIDENFVNLCGEDNGGCQHLCISTINNYTCECNSGWQLNNDSRTCSIVDSYLMYVQDGKLCGRILDAIKKSFVDLGLNNYLSYYEKLDSFDYDSHGDSIVYLQLDEYNSRIRIHFLSNDSSQFVINQHRCNVVPVIDWISKNLYMVENCGNNTSHIKIRKLYDYLENDKNLIDYEGSIKSFVVLPNLGRIFFLYSNITAEKNLLYSADLDGQNWKYKDDDDDVYKLDLAADSERELIYFLTKTEVFILDAYNLTTIMSYNIATIKDPKSITVYEGAVYISNTKELWYSTADEEPKLMMQAASEIKAFRVFSKNLQPIDFETQPCAIDNGGCQRYCFALPVNGTELESQCNCNDDEILGPDDKSCLKPLL